ncbi:hypothetical protein Kpol_1025p7 [Vanderwaltozyma polyspora DSM 70294]|uniref:Uncharacterized protein n=1 Tax=Vanderwaltozyma polyspora (strain ATCC 22028 / DSM 70294 / BCRC 21397 / CBS 2163 / NBRC 10782 / NRRL Y-8283 / UCD 57-17) TaxID=436907 RepID=A7TKT3_VANPO|nr:uncharacterized protein Kpol_1025p7 [Vanderwaltozyma polyspora DSM 70294]EDO17088.1 hypothetical protein Kpol_1025p7 [Vanderwaltozyma polyspora DSM 70294]
MVFPRTLLRGSRVKIDFLPKIITFDAYNTLYATTLPVFEQYCIIGEKYGIKQDPKKLTDAFPPIFKKLRETHPNYGKYTGISAREWWSILIHEVFNPIQVPEAMVNDILKRFDGTQAYRVFQDALEFLDLVKKGRPDIVVAIISNTDPLVYELLKNLKLDEYFEDNIYLSYDTDLFKPGSDFFDHVLEQIVKKNPNLCTDLGGVQELKKHCWHIGDEVINDMEGSEKAGWNGVLIDRTDKYSYISNIVNGGKRNESQLSIDKVNANHEKILEYSLANNHMIQLSDHSHVVSNLNVLREFLFGK